MLERLNVYFLPQSIRPESLEDSTVVVIDVLRATTTITCALAHGAREVIPFLEVEDARQAATRHKKGHFLLGGERGGVVIDGFDLGNSPSEYSQETVAGKTILFTTTNGTKALQHCRAARKIYLGAAVNLQAACRQLVSTTEVDLICSGTNGHLSGEDVLIAGAMVRQLTLNITANVALNDSARLARHAWNGLTSRALHHRQPLKKQLAQEFRSTLGGRQVAAVGHATDLDSAAAIDEFDIAPQLNVSDWRVHLP